jgi:hypothetical protein
MTSSKADDQTFLNLSVDQLTLLLQKITSLEEHTGLEAALFHSLSQSNEEIRSFARRVFLIVIRSLEKGEEGLHLMRTAAFLEAGSELINWGTELRRMKFEDLVTNGIEKLFTSLNGVFGTARYRLYTIHPKERCYRGLKSVEMGAEYSEEFDLTDPRRFGRTKIIPFWEPPYKTVSGTKCYKLAANDLTKIGEDAREWYRGCLKLGDRDAGVPETYTWEFTVDGLSSTLCQHVPDVDKMRYSFAFSLDTGIADREYKDRILTPVDIALMDQLWASSFGRHMGAFFGGRIEELYDRANPVQIEAVAAYVESQSKTLAPSDYARVDLPLTWEVPAMFIPCEKGDWVFAEDDERALRLFQVFMRLKGAPDRVFAIGPTGCGKENFLRAIHENGNRASNPIEILDCPRIRPEFFEATVMGTEADSHSRAREAMGLFERADGGSVILDEVTRIQEENSNALLQVLEALDKRTGFRRSGPSGRLVNPDVRVLSCGDISIKPLEDHFDNRIGIAVALPSWYELSIRSRIVILRWHLLRNMEARQLPTIQVSQELVEFFVSDVQVESLATKNMRHVRTWASALMSVVSPDNRLSLAVFLEQILKNDTRPKADASVAERLLAECGGKETFPERLILGNPSQIVQLLEPALSVAQKIAVCEQGPSCRGCISEQLLIEAVQAMDTEADILSGLYLFYSATNMRSTTFDGEDDPYRTGVRSMTRHLGTKSELLKSKVMELTGLQLHQFRSSGRERETGWYKLREHVSRERPMISALSERIKCTLPFFPDVPYWRAWSAHQPIEGA